MDRKDWAEMSKAWPFEEAKKLLVRLQKSSKKKDYLILETGYGPSGLPHIGTFGENARTSMIIQAFKELSDHPVKLVSFSDDMDGLRKVPDNVPNPEILVQNLGRPLTEVPDPFGTHDSFGAHNNARLKKFLDQFGFTYEFYSATTCYKEGLFDNILLRILEKHEEIRQIILPTLGEERKKTYSPFLPVDAETGRVLEAPILHVDPKAGTLVYQDTQGREVETSVLGGRCKLQWKVDWAARWCVLDVDYEMCGKDLTDSFTLSSKIARALGYKPPEGMIYELFLDKEGKKISKSKGNGLSLEKWLTYAPMESLGLYMYQKPKTSKRLYFEMIPKLTDEYFQHLKAAQNPKDLGALFSNPVWHIHGDKIPQTVLPISFSLLLNLASVVNAQDEDILWFFIRRYTGSASVEDPMLADLVKFAVQYYHDFIAPSKTYRQPTPKERVALESLRNALTDQQETTAEAYQTLVFSVGKENGYEVLREWFMALYQILLGQDSGPRFGSFIEIFGATETIALIEEKLKQGESPASQ